MESYNASFIGTCSILTPQTHLQGPAINQPAYKVSSPGIGSRGHERNVINETHLGHRRPSTLKLLNPPENQTDCGRKLLRPHIILNRFFNHEWWRLPVSFCLHRYSMKTLQTNPYLGTLQYMPRCSRDRALPDYENQAQLSTAQRLVEECSAHKVCLSLDAYPGCGGSLEPFLKHYTLPHLSTSQSLVGRISWYAPRSEMISAPLDGDVECMGFGGAAKRSCILAMIGSPR